jgi:serpin B
MYREGHYGLARLDGAMMIELPYDGNRMVMDVVLPAARDGIAEVEKRYAAHGVQPWLDQLKSVEVQLWLPRFKAQWGGELTGPLRALGIRQAFTNQADFTGIARTQDLRIAAVEHRAAVEVDEIGTKAVAATGIGIPAKAEPRREEKVKFRADHPFLYLIRDTRSGTVLFVGRLENPLQ